MRIEIDNYVITSDERQYIVSEKAVKKEGEKAGEEYLTNSRYFGKIEQAVNDIFERKVRKSDAKTLRELIEVAQGARETIKRHLEGVDEYRKEAD